MSARPPKYSLIEDQVLRDIQRGHYKLGDTLPTESDMMRAFGVSRHTVRRALSELRNRGVIVSQQGKGSVVTPPSNRGAFVESVQSIEELIAVGREARRSLITSEVIEADQELAMLFGGHAGRRILRVEMLRHGVEDRVRPICYTRIWMDGLFEPIVDELSREQYAVAELLELRYDRPTNFLHQIVRARSLDENEARHLGRIAGEATLEIERRYAASKSSPLHLLTRSVFVPTEVEVQSFFERRA